MSHFQDEEHKAGSAQDNAEREVEIIDLDDVHEDDRNGHVFSSASAVRVPLTSRLTARQRAFRLISTLAAALLIGLVVSTALLHGQALNLPFGISASTPTASPYIIPGGNLFYFDASPPWGQLFQDGHLITHPPATDKETPLQLSAGRHQFEWRAKPFRSLSCFISVPTRNSDTCLHTVANIPDKPEAQRILFYNSLNMLPPDQQAALIGSIQSALDGLQSSAIVQSGERFLHVQGQQAIDVAKQPLRATLTFHLDTADTVDQEHSSCFVLVQSCFLQYQDQTQNCLLFCTSTSLWGSLPQLRLPHWQVLVMMHASWTYTTIDGRILASNQPDALPFYTQFAHFLSLLINWDGRQWSVSIDNQSIGSGNPTCATADDTFDAQAIVYGPPGTINQYTFRSDVPGRVPADGCLLIASKQEATSPAPPSFTPATAAYCLYRFGLFVAANDFAHRYWPRMPLATPSERTLAQQMAAHYVAP